MNNSISKLKSVISRNIINIPGWRTKRKIVVIESDDWGSIRMPSKNVYEKFISNGFNIAESDYNRLDTLECNEDLVQLFDVLLAHKDSLGRPSNFTANMVVANPDFRKIRASGFRDYFYEPVTDTLKRYPNREHLEKLWKEGNEAHVFHPQFHSREHVNVVRWMDALKKRTPKIMFTFDQETTFSGDGDYNFMEVLDYNTPSDLHLMKESLSEGLALFEKIFGFRSKSFIPPCYIWNSEVEETLSEHGVKYLQGLVVQSVPTGSFGSYKRKYHFLGQRNRFGQYFLIRNCFFEPSLTRSSDPVAECLERISTAFRWNKPAIISSHRINYIGALDEDNRRRNLILLNDLLSRIVKLWPDVEFMASDELGDLIAGEHER